MTSNTDAEIYDRIIKSAYFLSVLKNIATIVNPYEYLADIVAIQMKASSMKTAMAKHSRVLEAMKRKSMLNLTYYAEFLLLFFLSHDHAVFVYLFSSHV